MKVRTIGFIGAGLLTVATAVFAQATVDGVKVSQRLQARLPRTQVTSVDCAKLNGVCEVIAGKTVFYTDANARYLFVGRLYDMETRQDLTAAKLLEINPETLLGGNPERDTGEEAAQYGAQPVPRSAQGRGAGPNTPAPRQAIARVDLSGLPAAGAINWGKSGGQPVTIFTDFRCGYCRALVATLEQMNVRVIERPISVLGSRDLSDRVYCARDKVRAARDAYAGLELAAATCDTSGLDANERFAQQHHFMGTPVIVRGDGTVLEGFRPKQFLEEWLKAS
ncbi:MAG: DsbC family protein [Sphingomonadales bacterium]|nr:DsbC family protein [Sphingomonadales bacterium]